MTSHLERVTFTGGRDAPEHLHTAGVMTEKEAFITRSREAQAVVLKVHADRVSEPQQVRALEKEAESAIDSGDMDLLVVDLGEAEYVISELFAALVGIKKRLDQVGKRFSVCCESPYIRDLFEVSHLNTIIDVKKTLDKALGRDSN